MESFKCNWILLSLIRILQFVFSVNTILPFFPHLSFSASPPPYPRGSFGSSSLSRSEEGKWQETKKEGYLWKHGSYVHVCRPHWCKFTWHIWVHHPVHFTISLPAPSVHVCVRACVCACVCKGEEERKLEGSSQKSTISLFLPTCPGVFLLLGIYRPQLKGLVICVVCISTALQIRLMTSSFLCSYDRYSIFQNTKWRL